jgi:hypothetical protein
VYRSIQTSYKFTRISNKIGVHRKGELLGDARNQMKCGNAKVRSQAGKLRQRLQGGISAPVAYRESMPGQKSAGGNAGSPAGTDTRPALVPGQAGTIGILQFGFNIRVLAGHSLILSRQKGRQSTDHGVLKFYKL